MRRDWKSEWLHVINLAEMVLRIQSDAWTSTIRDYPSSAASTKASLSKGAGDSWPLLARPPTSDIARHGSSSPVYSLTGQHVSKKKASQREVMTSCHWMFACLARQVHLDSSRLLDIYYAEFIQAKTSANITALAPRSMAQNAHRGKSSSPALLESTGSSR